MRRIEATNCNNLDLAIEIVAHPSASFWQKAPATAYIATWSGAHASVVLGVAASGYGIVSWGTTYLAANAAAAHTALQYAGPLIVGWSLLDDLAVAYGAVTGHPYAQQQAILAQQMSMADASSPLFDGLGGLRAFSNLLRRGLPADIFSCFSPRLFGGGGGPPGSVDDLIAAALRAQGRVGMTPARAPTIATNASGSIIVHSGWGFHEGYAQGTERALQLANDVGFTFRPHDFDDVDVPGIYYASHAEAQLLALKERAIGVSNELGMCPSCQHFFSMVASSRKMTFVVADPSTIHIFNPDGAIRQIPR
ncbi:MAG: hypothetical protein ACRDHL_00975 [Candidatus Promineifilaceae bacterium]